MAPRVSPVTIPEEGSTDATAGALLIHVPPGTAFVSGIVNPTQTLPEPLMGAGNELTVTVVVIKQPVPNV